MCLGERYLVIAPRGLFEQWQEEMAEKFSVGFDLLSRDRIEASITAATRLVSIANDEVREGGSERQGTRS